MKRLLPALLLGALVSPAFGQGRDSEFFVVWGRSGAWDCSLAIEGGQFTRVEPYLFFDAKDRILEQGSRRVTCVSVARGSAVGLHLFVEAGPAARLRFTSNRAAQDMSLAALPERGEKIVALGGSKDFLIFGRGDPGFGPQDGARNGLPPIFAPPEPRDPIALPAEWSRNPGSVIVRLSEMPAGPLVVRRGSKNDGRLYLELSASQGSLRGTAEVEVGGALVGRAVLDGALWLSLSPRIGRIALTLASPGGTQQLTAPTTLVETKGGKLFLNGEPFLIKGTLPGNLTPEDAQYIKGLGMNTVRTHDVAGFAERYGFMAIASIQGGGLKKLAAYNQPGGEQKLAADLPTFLQNEREKGAAAAVNPYTLLIQLDNERTTTGGNPLDSEGGGGDPWCDFVDGPKSEFGRLNDLLAKDWNVVKPLDPMVPLGYANESQGYIAPPFLDVVMHNTYLEKDRYGVPLKEFMRWQGCERRPFVNTEYGANRYLPEAYHGSENNPLLEKLQAWGYRQTWNAFMRAGTVGGTGYRLYDLDPGEPADQGARTLGIMTVNREPKLACWELWHLWRDFEVEPTADEGTLNITYKSDCWARNCRLTITRNGKQHLIEIADFAPGSHRLVKVRFGSDSFHWQIDFTTHSGLNQMAVGAYPRALEEQDFLDREKTRKTYGFIKRLLSAKVLTVQGREPPPTVAEMKQEDGIVPIAFQCPDGVVYVTAFARSRPGKSWYVKAALRTAFTGSLKAVDEWSGLPSGAKVKWKSTNSGITIEDVEIPVIPGPIGQRSNSALSMPVFEITPGPAHSLSYRQALDASLGSGRSGVSGRTRSSFDCAGEKIVGTD